MSLGHKIIVLFFFLSNFQVNREENKNFYIIIVTKMCGLCLREFLYNVLSRILVGTNKGMK